MKKFLTKSILFIAAGLFAASSLWADVTPQTYCNFTHEKMCHQGTESDHIVLTWQTLRNGDVKISISEGEGSHYVAFRDAGFEGDMNGFTVVLKDESDVQTEVAASTYFNRPGNEQVNNYRDFILTRNSTAVPTGQSIYAIRFYNNAIAWRLTKGDESQDSRWMWPADVNAVNFVYAYGTHCQSIAAPTNVSISATGRISFDEVAGADGYEVTIYDGSTLIHSQDVAKNDILDFVAMSTTTLSVYVRALKEDFIGPRSDEYEWSVEAGHVYAHSYYCDKEMDQASTEGTIGAPSTEQHSLIGFTWETLQNGNVLITLSEKDGGEAGTALFRGNGMGISNFYINGTQNDGENAIFETEADHANLNYYTLKVKE